MTFWIMAVLYLFVPCWLRHELDAIRYAVEEAAQ